MWHGYDTVTAHMTDYPSMISDHSCLDTDLIIMDTNNQYNSDEETLDEVFGANLEDVKEAYRQVALECAKIFVQIIGTTVLAFRGLLYNKTSYHTSALSGLDWVLELMNGHPGHIQNELGVHKYIFGALLHR